MPQIKVFYTYYGGANTAYPSGEGSSADAFDATGWAGSALAFSGASGPNSNITVGTVNLETHVVASTASGISQNSIKQLNNWAFITGAGTDTGAALDSATSGGYIDIGDNATAATYNARGLQFWLNHATTAIKANPVYLWAGAGDSVDIALDSCKIRAFDITLAQANTNKKWIVLDYNSSGGQRLTASAHTGSSAQDHYWSFGLTVIPTDVGLKTNNALLFEATYY